MTGVIPLSPIFGVFLPSRLYEPGFADFFPGLKSGVSRFFAVLDVSTQNRQAVLKFRGEFRCKTQK